MLPLLVAVALTAALAACGGDDDAGRGIPLVPNTAAAGRHWTWTANCRVGPRRTTGCDDAGPEIGPAQLAGNEWNLGVAPMAMTQAAVEPGTTPGTNGGALTMAVGASGGLTMRGAFSNAPPCTDPSCIAPEANTWVRGFPSVLYGIDQCNAETSPRQSPALVLPARVGFIPPSLVGTTSYDMRAPNATYDVAYDLWLNPSSTKTPCQTDGTLEVMVWTDHDARALLPDSLKVATTAVPYAVEGSTHTGSNTWSIYVSNVGRDGHTAPWGGTVWLVLDDPHTVQKGSISVDLSAALGTVGELLHDNYGWTSFGSNYWLDTIAFGVEHGPSSADPYAAEPVDFDFDLHSYCLNVGASVASTSC